MTTSQYDWTDEAWVLFEAVVESHGAYIEHCVHCSGRQDRGFFWTGTNHPHPTCLIIGALPTTLRFDAAYYTGC